MFFILNKKRKSWVSACKDDDILSIIDGVQRLSTTRDYLDNKFILSKDLEPVTVNGNKKEIAKKNPKNQMKKYKTQSKMQNFKFMN